MTALAIETSNLTRRFGQLRAVDSVSLHVPQETVYGFLGRNGAGKTTTLRMILGLIRPHSGRAHVLGHDVVTQRTAAARLTGALLEADGFYRNLTGYENLDLSRRLLDLPRAAIDRVLEVTSITASANKRVGGYSLGMRQRLGIARALIASPRVLILDEPTNGLDPDGITDMRHFLTTLPERTGATVLVSSHLLGEVELTADHIGIIHQGRLVAEGRLDHLIAELPARLNIDTSDAGRALALVQARGFNASVERDRVFVDLDSNSNSRKLAGELNRALIESGIEVFALNDPNQTLETLYRRVTRCPPPGEVA